MTNFKAGLTRYLTNFGEGLDRFLNAALFMGDYRETISLHSAEDEALPKPRLWACVMCKWLSLTVEKDHCPKTRRGAAMAQIAGLKALFWLCVLAGIVVYGPLLLLRFL